MVTGGVGPGGWRNFVSVELLFTNGTYLCSLPDLPGPRYEHTQNGPMLCGGYETIMRHSCVKFCGGFWNETHSSLRKPRTSHGSWASPGGLMLIGGNFGRSTSEVLTDDGQSTMHWDPAWPASDETIKYHIISSPS